MAAVQTEFDALNTVPLPVDIPQTIRSAGAFEGDRELFDLFLVLQLEQTGDYSIAQVFRADRIDIYSCAAFKSSRITRSPTDQYVPGNVFYGVNWTVVPLFVTRDLATHRGVTRVYDITDSA